MPRFEVGSPHPFDDLLRGGAHPFPPDIEEWVRMIAAIDEDRLPDGGRPFDADMNQGRVPPRPNPIAPIGRPGRIVGMN